LPANSRDPGAPARYAVIDVGTNSVKSLIAERAGDGHWVTIRDRADVTRLGESLAESGEISSAATARTADAIAVMVAEAQLKGALAIAAVGTAAFRIAGNRVGVVAAIEDRTGIRVEVISGEEESRLAYLAVRAGVGLDEGSLAVFDTGGGSTQLTFVDGDRVDERFSVGVGALRYTERFGLARAVDDATLEAALTAISADLARLDGHRRVDAWSAWAAPSPTSRR
jgi:exopolyphosphatase / guanosine-5'-triphosphate,3'-diphosphate pyrophosphatase